MRFVTNWKMHFGSHLERRIGRSNSLDKRVPVLPVNERHTDRTRMPIDARDIGRM